VVRVLGSEELGYWVGELPRGCRLCMAGAKSVVFVTGLCSVGCFYCPISSERRGRDVTYVNDVRVYDLKDLVDEVAASMSEGVGITGGEPLEVLDRVVTYVRVLKEVFGRGFHVHVYTSGLRLDGRSLEVLVDAGVDEVRVHVVNARSVEAVRLALQYPVDVVVENPALPGALERLKELVGRLYELGVRYVNLNELEVSESNYLSLAIRGYTVSGSGRSVVGSREVAVELIRWVASSGMGISVHYCPATYKDLYQYPARLSRRARATRRVFEVVGWGTVRWVEGEGLEELWLKDLAVRVGSRYATHIKLGRVIGRGVEVEALPLTPRRVLNEEPLGGVLDGT
jgi:pyruvate formate-lyase activating enzyme-like uncharacterized protein